LSTFKKVFDLNLTFQLEFKISEKKIENLSIFPQRPKLILAHLAWQPDRLPFLFFLVFLFVQPISLPAHSALAGPLAHHPVTSFHLQSVALPPPLAAVTAAPLFGAQ
jgi:hypothetical protein